ncbi:MAG: deoxycytidylate deaminase [Patescibacteria group bacterium]
MNNADKNTTIKQKDLNLMKKACLLCDQATCMYKTACLAVKNGKVIVSAYNETLPGEKYCQDGECIRKKLSLTNGADIGKVCSIHAEVNLIAKAAASGLCLKDSTIYVTTFPCYVCSKSLVQARINYLYYMSDYACNEGGCFFKAADIPIFKIPEEKVWQ